MTWRLCQVLLAIFNVAFAALALYFIFKGGVVTPASQAIEYKDFIAILLAAIAVIVALVTILLALAAVWGFALIRDEARKGAETAAAKIATERTEQMVPGLVDQAMKLEAESSGVQGDKIAEEYGKEPPNG